MKVSVVIPAYNEAGYIGQCLKSVIREVRASGLEAEIVVVDNASTDGTGDVVRRFPGVKLVREPQRGLSAARHRGYLESCGELIANLDADCLMSRGWLAKSVRAFGANHRLVCLSGPFIYYDLPDIPKIIILLFYVFGSLLSSVSQYLLKMGGLAQGGNFTIRRSALDKVGGYNTSIEFHGEDTDVAKRLARVGAVRFSLRYTIRSSGRRLAKQGVLRTGYVNAMNNFFVLFYGRPITRTHSDIRAL